MTEDTRERLRDAVMTSLRMVIDPELGENVVELGLIYGVDIADDGAAIIEMTTTTRGCPATAYIKEAVQTAAWEVDGVSYADVRLTYEPPWSPDRMSGAARERFGA